MDERRKRLDDLIKRRDQAREVLQRSQGRLESARADVKSIEDECRQKKIEPDKLPAAITQLETRFDKAVDELESKIKDVEAQVAPYLSE